MQQPGGREGSQTVANSTTLSIVSIDLSTLETLHAPTYRVVDRRAWTGLNHLAIFGQLKALAESWRPQQIVIDATGVGEGLWALLDKAFPTRVIPVKFSASTKSDIGYRFLAVIETGRFRDCYATRAEAGGLSGMVDPQEVDRQYAACRAEVLTGPRKTMRWGVPDGSRDENGGLLHDDFVLAELADRHPRPPLVAAALRPVHHPRPRPAGRDEQVQEAEGRRLRRQTSCAEVRPHPGLCATAALLRPSPDA